MSTIKKIIAEEIQDASKYCGTAKCHVEDTKEEIICRRTEEGVWSCGLEDLAKKAMAEFPGIEIEFDYSDVEKAYQDAIVDKEKIAKQKKGNAARTAYQNAKKFIELNEDKFKDGVSFKFKETEKEYVDSAVNGGHWGLPSLNGYIVKGKYSLLIRFTVLEDVNKIKMMKDGFYYNSEYIYVHYQYREYKNISTLIKSLFEVIEERERQRVREAAQKERAEKDNNKTKIMKEKIKDYFEGMNESDRSLHSKLINGVMWCKVNPSNETYTIDVHTKDAELINKIVELVIEHQS